MKAGSLSPSVVPGSTEPWFLSDRADAHLAQHTARGPVRLPGFHGCPGSEHGSTAYSAGMALAAGDPSDPSPHGSITVSSRRRRDPPPPPVPGSLRRPLPHGLEAGVAALLGWPRSLSPAALEVTPSPARHVVLAAGGRCTTVVKALPLPPLGTFRLLGARGLPRGGLVFIHFLGHFSSRRKGSVLGCHASCVQAEGHW